MIDYDEITKRFLLGEAQQGPTVKNYIQLLGEVLNSIKTRTNSDFGRISIAKQHLREIKKLTRKLEERVLVLEEQVKILEEGK